LVEENVARSNGYEVRHATAETLLAFPQMTVPHFRVVTPIRGRA
jgi:hypothetical protein